MHPYFSYYASFVVGEGRKCSLSGSLGKVWVRHHGFSLGKFQPLRVVEEIHEVTFLYWQKYSSCRVPEPAVVGLLLFWAWWSHGQFIQTASF